VRVLARGLPRGRAVAFDVSDLAAPIAEDEVAVRARLRRWPASRANLIEEAFSSAKAYLQRHRAYAVENPKHALGSALDQVGATKAAGYFRHAGYRSRRWLIEGLVYADD
jgi:hypothetical protein